jgi:hypothetical protein
MYVEECARMDVFLSYVEFNTRGVIVLCADGFFGGAILCDGCIFFFPPLLEIEWRPANAQKKTFNRTRVYKKERKKRKKKLFVK